MTHRKILVLKLALALLIVFGNLDESTKGDVVQSRETGFANRAVTIPVANDSQQAKPQLSCASFPNLFLREGLPPKRFHLNVRPWGDYYFPAGNGFSGSIITTPGNVDVNRNLKSCCVCFANIRHLKKDVDGFIRNGRSEERR